MDGRRLVLVAEDAVVLPVPVPVPVPAKAMTRSEPAGSACRAFDGLLLRAGLQRDLRAAPCHRPVPTSADRLGIGVAGTGRQEERRQMMAGVARKYLTGCRFTHATWLRLMQ
jgi:hypothetical protein